MDGGILSQDEINALLNGMDLSAEPSANENPQETESEPVPMTFEEAKAPEIQEEYLRGTPPVAEDDALLTDVEKDAIGEVANISMGSSATTLYSLVNRKVNITTPVVRLARWENLIDQYEAPCVFIQIKYTHGLDGTNILVLKEQDVKVITDLMMGGDGSNTEGEITELHLSAISEAMNQMMGSAATSLSTMLNTMIDISPPDSSLLNLPELETGEAIAPFLGGTFVKISFRMQIDDLVDSTIMQLYPIDFAKKLVETFISTQMGETPTQETPPTEPEPQKAGDQFAYENQMNQNASAGMNTFDQNAMNAMNNPMGMNSTDMNNANMNPMGMNNMNMMGMNGMNGMNMNPMGMNGMNMSPMGNMSMNGMNAVNPFMGMNMNPMQGAAAPQMNAQNVTVQPAQFQSFSSDLGNAAGQENIGLIMDVPLNVTVELGRTTKSISEILNFAPGTIIELDRIAGEPIDVLVNGKFVAKGEVVVIEENFGIRVTEIIK